MSNTITYIVTCGKSLYVFTTITFTTLVFFKDLKNVLYAVIWVLHILIILYGSEKDVHKIVFHNTTK